MIKTNRDKLASDIHKKLDENVKISKKIYEVDKKQSEKLDRNVDEVKNDLSILETLPQELTEIKEKVVTVEKNLSNAIETNRQDINKSNEKTSELERKIDNIPASPTTIAPVGSQVDEVDQRHRNMSLVINGLHTQFQTKEGILGFGKEMLKINMDMRDIDEVANLVLNMVQQPSTKVTFTSLSARNRYYKARAQLIGSKTMVWVNEDLSKGREILARDVRLRVKGNGVYKTWTFMGLIYVKTSEKWNPSEDYQTARHRRFDTTGQSNSTSSM